MSKAHLAGVQLAALPRLPFASLQEQMVCAVVLALGSNHRADYYVPYAQKSLAQLGEMSVSSAYQSPDITATAQQPKPDYINQCVYLSLDKSMRLVQLQHTVKRLENDCDRQRASKSSKHPIKIVTMDIDILLIKLEYNTNSLSSNNWVILAERYPFADHDATGINQLQKTAR